MTRSGGPEALRCRALLYRLGGFVDQYGFVNSKIWVKPIRIPLVCKRHASIDWRHYQLIKIISNHKKHVQRMLTDFAMDLRLARRKSGLYQQDVAHLLAIDQSTYSDLERGVSSPTLNQITQLSLNYGRSFHSLFEEIASNSKPDLLARMDTLPERKRPYVAAFHRNRTLKRMRARLTNEEHGA